MMSRFHAGDLVEVTRDRRNQGLEGARGTVELVRSGSGRTVLVKFHEPNYQTPEAGLWFRDDELEDVEQRLVVESLISSVLGHL